MIFIARGALFIMSVFEKAWMCFSSLSPVRSTNSSQLKSCVALIFAICISVSISFLLLICIHSSSCSVIPHTQCAHTWFHCVSLTHTFTLFSVSLTDTKKSVWCHTLTHLFYTLKMYSRTRGHVHLLYNVSLAYHNSNLLYTYLFMALLKHPKVHWGEANHMLM